MNQLPLFSAPRWTVTEFTRRVRRLLESDEALMDVWVQGEISNFSRPASGHLYFTLKDAGASVRCVMWRSDAARLRGAALMDGLLVQAHGKVGVYEPSGQYQLILDTLQPAGEGALYAQFLHLKAALEAEGLFDPARKRPLPQLPRHIGLVTSATGAAVRDILHTLGRRLPLAQVTLVPSLVQGETAPAALLAALQKLSALQPAPDVILLARGGGSLEDLWAFNEENLVRAIAASPIPIITGVGHETDFTLADFAADLRAPTPTAAAELATPYTFADLSALLQGSRARLNDLLTRQLQTRAQALQAHRSALRYHSPARRLPTEAQRVDDLARRAQRSLTHRVQMEETRLAGFLSRLNALNPLAILQRGYAIVTDQTSGQVLQSTRQAQAGQILRVKLAHGALKTRIEAILPEE
jgi:exodeoxyribonuclease VII large subunit